MVDNETKFGWRQHQQSGDGDLQGTLSMHLRPRLDVA
jgi:hypothetical protein